MAYEVVYTDAFADEYDAAIQYHIDTLKMPKAAGDLVEAMSRAFEFLASTPAASAVSQKPLFETLELREHLVKNYVIVYRIDGKKVYLLHMFHQSQDFGNRL